MLFSAYTFEAEELVVHTYSTLPISESITEEIIHLGVQYGRALDGRRIHTAVAKSSASLHSSNLLLLLLSLSALGSLKVLRENPGGEQQASDKRSAHP